MNLMMFWILDSYGYVWPTYVNESVGGFDILIACWMDRGGG